MRLLVLSDLHLETLPRGETWRLPAAPAHDVAVLAGDVHRDVVASAAWAMEYCSTPVVLVAGNHEYHGSSVPMAEFRGREINASHAGVPNPVHVLECRSATIAGVRFLGATLWTDFGLHGTPAASMVLAARQVADHYQIDGFSPLDAMRRHYESVLWLVGELATPHDGPTVVVTHHAPSRRSISAMWETSPTSPAYASDLDHLVERWQPNLWIHGHVHDSFDYRIGRTRVLCNPRGFGEGQARFDPSLVVEVGASPWDD